MAAQTKSFILNIKKSILAGALIALAGWIYLQAPNKIVGAFLFGIGLVSVFMLQANLYTGKVGYAQFKTAPDCIAILVLNTLTAFGIGVLYRLVMGADIVMGAKLAKSLWRVFADACGCGALIYLAVEMNKRGNIIGIIMCVMGFILAGFEHSIADAFYIGTCGLTMESLVFFLVVAGGNAVGAKLIHWIVKT